MPILDLVPFIVHYIITETWVKARTMKGEHPRCGRALDKVMMKPVVRWNNSATFMPRTDYFFLPLRPHE
ncbi:MAG: hypothetical protein O6837_04835 [Deltaproteobacteria bacterium]|nr:hypothetical protein [Deltaproteobacteria bacterium]MCZ6563643.1 hypothetical protein [Deltaproteobacteria bacterium]